MGLRTVRTTAGGGRSTAFRRGDRVADSLDLVIEREDAADRLRATTGSLNASRLDMYGPGPAREQDFAGV